MESDKVVFSVAHLHPTGMILQVAKLCSEELWTCVSNVDSGFSTQRGVPEKGCKNSPRNSRPYDQGFSKPIGFP